MNQTVSAGFLRHGAQCGLTVDGKDELSDRLRWTPVNVDEPVRMCGRRLPAVANGDRPDPRYLPCSTEHQMADMRMAFAASGGLLTVGELAQGNDPHSRARFGHIARGIATREIIGFMWQSEPWVPMFQFDAGPRMLPRKALRPLFELLVPLYDPWEMANWFVRPNQWLTGHRPVDDCAGHLAAVLDVAHLEHFIATGQTPWWQHRATTRTTCN
jgi:hypothetical protein